MWLKPTFKYSTCTTFVQMISFICCSVLIYGGAQAQYSTGMHIAVLPSCFFSSLLSTFLLCWVLFFSAEHLSSMLRVFSAEHFFCSAEHFSSFSKHVSPLLSIFLLCAYFFFAEYIYSAECFLLWQAFFFLPSVFFFSTEQFSLLPKKCLVEKKRYSVEKECAYHLWAAVGHHISIIVF